MFTGSSDMDISVIAPAGASMESDFFMHLHDLIETIPHIKNLTSVRRAKVPLLKFSVRGVDVDLACVRLKTNDMPTAKSPMEGDFHHPAREATPEFDDQVDKLLGLPAERRKSYILTTEENLWAAGLRLTDPTMSESASRMLYLQILWEQEFCISAVANESSRLTLESVKSNLTIFECLQANSENFVQATRFLKYWASRRGIYGNINCYIGGVHLVVMVASVCQLYRVASFAWVISSFFNTFSQWSWDMPVMLHGENVCSSRAVYMAIQKPGTDTVCSSNVTPTTLARIRDELQRGYELTRLLSHDWSSLLDEFCYEEVYGRFVKVRISGGDDEIDIWMGLVKSRIYLLIQLLEANGILCDPNLIEFRDLSSRGSIDCKDDNRVFLWGIVDDTGEKYNLTGSEESWRHNLTVGGLKGQVKLAVIPRMVYCNYKRHNLVKRT
ncbi:hypothetical protein OROGR_015837 [Orobanche gracilis]